jgi:hypothetical protein
MPPRPVLKDQEAWRLAILEHRRALFERVVAEFPELMKTKRSQVDIMRIKLSGPRLSS